MSDTCYNFFMRKGHSLTIIAVLIWIGIICTIAYTYISEKSEIKTEKIIDISHNEYDKYNELNSNEKYLYDLIVSQLTILSDGTSDDSSISFYGKSIGLSGAVSADLNGFNSSGVFKAIQIDYPYYDCLFGDTINYHVVQAKSLTGYGNAEITIEFNTDKETLSKYRNAYNNAKIIVNQTIDYDDLIKMNYFKEYLLDNVAYDYNTADEDILQRSIINAFDEDYNTSVVCAGYAKAFKLLCDLSKVQTCYYVQGTLNNSSHAWNKYFSDGTFYLIDITNSSNGSIGQNGQLYMKEVVGSEYALYPSSNYANYIEE